ncbi:hypothetical protein [Rossellomorea marisflavi]|uniref:hypothetical protein n=1 Tax=Rossellomorea marisflavi TaxID=189381 RepID=UPI003FA0DD4C
MLTGIQKVERIKELMVELKNELLTLPSEIENAKKTISECDKVAQDIEHIIESCTLSGSESARLVSHFHTIRKERRQAKDVVAFSANHMKELSKIKQTITNLANVFTKKASSKYQIKTQKGFELLNDIVSNYQLRSSVPMVAPKKKAVIKTPLIVVEGATKSEAQPKSMPMIGKVQVVQDDKPNYLFLQTTSGWRIWNKSPERNSKVSLLPLDALLEKVYNEQIPVSRLHVKPLVKNHILSVIANFEKQESSISKEWLAELKEKALLVKEPLQKYNLVINNNVFSIIDYNDGNRTIFKTSNLKTLIQQILTLEKRVLKVSESIQEKLKALSTSSNVSEEDKNDVKVVLSNIAS